MEPGAGAGADSDGGGDAADQGRRDDDRGGSSPPQAPVEGGEGPVQRYSIDEVERLAKRGDWAGLEQYIRMFVPEGALEFHPELLLMCRRGQFAVSRGEGAKAYFTHRILPLCLQDTPYAVKDTFNLKVQELNDSLVHGRMIKQLPNIADKINDYMRFYFREAIGFPEPEIANGKVWAFALLERRSSNRQGIYRCLLCQTKIKRDSQEKQYNMLFTHLEQNCLGMNSYTSQLLREYTGISEDDVSTVKRSSDGPVPSNEKEKQAIRGLEILQKMKLSGVNLPFINMSEECLNKIRHSSDAEIIKSQILHGKALLLDMVLDTNVPKEHCLDLRNWFTSIQNSENIMRRTPPSPPDEINPNEFLSDKVPVYYAEDVLEPEDETGEMMKSKVRRIYDHSAGSSSESIVGMIDHDQVHASNISLSSGNEQQSQNNDPSGKPLQTIVDMIDRDMQVQAGNTFVSSENEN